MRVKKSVIAVWALQIILAIVFLSAGAGKLTQLEAVARQFANWGLPDHFHIVIAIVEAAGAILILVPKTTIYAAAMLMTVMVGAAMTHLFNGEFLQITSPAIFMALLSGVLYLRRRKTPVSGQSEPIL